jgi:hypothetical protein
MKRLMVYCEGLTEESFVKTVLAPYFFGSDIVVTPIGAGGVSRYNKIKKELTRICKGDPTAVVTTMFDFYGFPGSAPGVATASGSIYAKARHIETAVEEDLGEPSNLFFNLTIHEFEGLLFANTSAFKNIADDKQLMALERISESFETPEHINDSYDTVPSKRIEKIIPSYSKVNDGSIIAGCIGIDRISAKCQHFSEWITRIAVLAKEGV